MAAEEGDIITFIFTCVRGEVIPQNATHVIAHESVKVIPEELFFRHLSIVELICHAGVERIEGWAFYECPRLRRLIIPGVKIVEARAFCGCEAVTYVECDNLERVGGNAFCRCKSLSNINLPSVRRVDNNAFFKFQAMADPKFGNNLESIGLLAFAFCPSLQRITVPLKNGLFAESTFTGCDDLKRVDLVEGAVLHQAVAALLSDKWRNNMKAEVEAINQILPNSPAGDFLNVGGKARAIREWMTSVLRKIIYYKAHHRRLLNVAATSLQLALPHDIVMNNILPFLDLPSHTFEGEDYEEEEEDGSNRSDDTEDSYDTSDGADNDEGGAHVDSNNEDQLHDASFGRGITKQRGDEVQRKRRKTDNDE